MKTCLSIVALWLATMGLGLWLSQRPSPERDLARRDLVNAIFGQARTALSFAMFERADLYFHGGVAHLHEPHHAEHGGHVTPGTAGAHHGFSPFHIEPAPAGGGTSTGKKAPEAHGGPRGYRIVHEHHAEEAIPAWDVWSRLDHAVHPHSHRHLHGRRFEKEILPWLWAAVHCDPHNIEAWDVTAYWVADRLGRPFEGLKLLREGIRDNPYSFRLEFTRGQVLLHLLHKERAAFDAFLAAKRKWEYQQKHNPPQKKPDTLHYGHILVYLAVLSERRGQWRQAVRYYEQALPYRKDQNVIRARLRKALEHLSSTKAPSRTGA